MEGLSQLKEATQRLYAAHSGMMDIVGKGVLALFCFIWIRTRLSASPLFSNIFVILVAALICSVLPLWATALASGIFIIGQAFAVGLDVGALTAVIFLILYLLLLRFVPENGIVFILQPIAMFFGLPALLPICLGLKKTPASVLAVISGSVCYYLLENLKENTQNISGTGMQDYLERLQLILGGLVSNREMVVQLLALIGVLLIVYALRRLGFTHAPAVAIIIGALVYLLFVILGNAVAQTAFVLPAVLIGLLLTAFIALVLQMTLLPVNYQRTERLEFEDDDFVYYVRAVPKIEVKKPRQRRREGNATDQASLIDLEQKLTDSLDRL